MAHVRETGESSAARQAGKTQAGGTAANTAGAEFVKLFHQLLSAPGIAKNSQEGEAILGLVQTSTVEAPKEAVEKEKPREVKADDSKKEEDHVKHDDSDMAARVVEARLTLEQNPDKPVADAAPQEEVHEQAARTAKPVVVQNQVASQKVQEVVEEVQASQAAQPANQNKNPNQATAAATPAQNEAAPNAAAGKDNLSAASGKKMVSVDDARERLINPLAAELSAPQSEAAPVANVVKSEGKGEADLRGAIQSASQGMMTAAATQGGIAGEFAAARPGAMDGVGKIHTATGANGELMQKLTDRQAKLAKTAVPDSKQGEFIEKIQKLLSQASETKDGNTLTFKINPPELGKMTVRVTQRGDELYARITPEDKDVEAALRSKIGEITQVLQSSGLRVSDVHVSIGAERSESEGFNGYMLANGNNGGNNQQENGSFADQPRRESEQQSVYSGALVQPSELGRPIWVA